jgi:hypothetical protein
MKRISPDRRLSLVKQSLRTLTAEEMGTAGGASTIPCVLIPTRACPSVTTLPPGGTASLPSCFPTLTTITNLPKLP